MERLREDIYPEVLAALEGEYGSLENALSHFQNRYKDYAPRIMAERDPRYLDPIIIQPLNGKRGVNFFDEHCSCSWALTDPRPGSMVDLLTRHDLLDVDAPSPKICQG